MRAFKRSRIAVPLISIVAAFAFSAQAQEQQHKPPQGQGQAGSSRSASGDAPASGQVRGPQGPRVRTLCTAIFRQRNFGGHAYHGRLAWEGGRWRHEMHNGRMGWWWDVGGVWYFYPQPMDGPPTYVSDVEVMDDVAGSGRSDGPPGPGPGYPPPPVAATRRPRRRAPDPAASAVGGAIVGGVLGGLISAAGRSALPWAPSPEAPLVRSRERKRPHVPAIIWRRAIATISIRLDNTFRSIHAVAIEASSTSDGPAS